MSLLTPFPFEPDPWYWVWVFFMSVLGNWSSESLAGFLKIAAGVVIMCCSRRGSEIDVG